jgi:hypothetical protein
MMLTSRPLFAWEDLEDAPTLRTIREFLKTIPDAALLRGLREHRGRGRDDYPVSVLWGVVLLNIALRHPTHEACLAELRRNEGLRRLIGIASEDDVPKKWNVSRFLETLGQEPHLSRMRACFNAMIQRLGEVVPDLGKDTAGDSSTLNARPAPGSARTPSAENEKIEYDEHGLPQPAGGRKEYTDDEGKVVKVLEWFGYKFHLLVDVKHEVVVAAEITSTKTADADALPDLLKQAQANLPKGRIETLAYDKACDTNAVHELLHEEEITPVIQIRQMWQNQTEQKLAGHDGNSPVVYDEHGTVFCYDTASTPPVKHRMAYVGHEPARETLKYRCPAMHQGWECPMSSECNAGKTYGLTVRVDQSIDLRRFPPLPRATKKFERLYKGRTSVERVNGRFKLFWGADDGTITGAPRFFAFIHAVLIVHAAFATVLASAPRREGTLSKASLSPIAKALRQKLDAIPTAAN